MAGSKKPENERRSLDEQMASTARELQSLADAEVVAEAEREIREQLAAEMRQRLSRAVKARAAARKTPTAAQAKEEEIERFSLKFRIQHILLFSSCIILILTGLPLKFPNTHWAAFFFSILGGVPASGLLHRIGATLLIIVGVAHMCYITLTAEGRREFRQLIPKPKDVFDVIGNVRYFLGLAKQGARFGRFSYIEKFDYWAVYWGMVVMITSGLMLWFEDATMRLLPKFAVDMAREAHSDEALLATLAIIVWHFYNVHLSPDCFPMSKTWLTGKITKSKMMSHHPLEYEEMIAASLVEDGNGKIPNPTGGK
ncbi:MAG: cytochrome b/b6 domain-containing protein [Armatimonadota bacterium]|nr:cytochrome b/b6 domain-containing protein [Armatimonadota bacterium]